MIQPNETLEKTFLELAAIDEVHPHEDKILAYIKNRLETAEVPYQQDRAGNIVGRIKGPGTAAVALSLELADYMHADNHEPSRPVELIFTVGEEAGCIGAVALDMSLVSAKSALVLDWMGGVGHVVTASPAYFKIDVEYIGRTAHPAEWRAGKNAGAALIDAAGQLKVGEYAPGVTCNIGIFEFGKARNQVPGRAWLQADLRSFDTAKIEAAAAQVEQLFRQTAEKHGVEPKLSFVRDSSAYRLKKSGKFYGAVTQALAATGLEPVLESTYGCFDGNILAARGLEVIILGAGYYAPHSPGEYLSRRELAEAFEFIKFVA